MKPEKEKNRGRPRCKRRISYTPNVTYFKPRGVPMTELEVCHITIEEFEALRLADLEGFTQEEAANIMGISRRAFWDDLKSARRKIAFALTTGCAIEIKSNTY